MDTARVEGATPAKFTLIQNRGGICRRPVLTSWKCGATNKSLITAWQSKNDVIGEQVTSPVTPEMQGGPDRVHFL
jgi:hypothetical protein